MPPVGFELTISADERPQTYALDRTATGIGDISIYRKNFKVQQASKRDEMMCDVITHIPSVESTSNLNNMNITLPPKAECLQHNVY
jgi:hypothetical protein